MSRLGKIPVEIPEKVKVAVAGQAVTVEGPLGKLSWSFRPEVKVKVDGRKVVVERSADTKLVKALHGTTRSLIAGMVKGVTQGYEKILEISGVGYQAKLQGDKLTLILGFSHPIDLAIPKELTAAVPHPTAISVKGSDKQRVGEFAAVIRSKRPAEPYNLKGIKYRDETVRKKAGKTFVTGAS